MATRTAKKTTTKKRPTKKTPRKKTTRKKATRKKTVRKKATKKKVAKKKSTGTASVDQVSKAGQEEVAIRNAIQARRGRESVVLGGHVMSEVKEFIPTGIWALDNYVCGGGFPVGRITELAAEEGGGKTSLAIQALGHAQRAGGLAVYIDGEISTSRERFETFGTDYDKTLFTQPATLEEAMDDLKTAVSAIHPSRGPNLVVIDSIAALPPQRELDEAEKKPGEVASILTKRLRPMLKSLAEKRVALLCINQVRDNIGGGLFAPDTYTPGGRLFKHALSLRLHIFGGKKVENSKEEHIGKDLTFITVKNRLTAPYRKLKIRLNYANGWEDEWTTITAAKRFDLIEKGAHFNAATHATAKSELEEEWGIEVGSATGGEELACQPEVKATKRRKTRRRRRRKP